MACEQNATVRHDRPVILPDNANQWNPGRHTEPFYDGNLDDYTVSESEKEKRKNKQCYNNKKKK